MNVKAEIDAGVCGFHSIVEAASPDGMDVVVRIESNCPRVQAMAAELTALDALDEILRKPLVETTPALLAAKHRLHAPCLVPVGLLKAIEAAAGLALPADCRIVLARVE